MEAISKKLELATNVAVLCLVVLFVGRLALGVANHREIPKPAPTVPPSLIQPKMPRDAAFEQAPRTLVLVLSSECHFCQKSVPELATLSTEAERKFRIPTVAVFRPSDRGADAFLRETGFVGNVIKISAPQLSSLPTPTLLLVNDKEQVLGNWVGQVTPERASTILSAMAATRAPKSMK